MTSALRASLVGVQMIVTNDVSAFSDPERHRRGGAGGSKPQMADAAIDKLPEVKVEGVVRCARDARHASKIGVL